VDRDRETVCVSPCQYDDKTCEVLYITQVLCIVPGVRTHDLHVEPNNKTYFYKHTYIQTYISPDFDSTLHDH